MSDSVKDDVNAPPVLESLVYLWQMNSYKLVAVTMSFGGLVGSGSLAWLPAFFVRVHGMLATDVGFWFGLSVMFGLIGGSLTVGWLADKLGQREIKCYMRVSGGGSLLAGSFAIAGAWWPTVTGSLVLFAGFLFFLSFHMPPVLAITSTLIKPHMRGAAATGVMLCQNLLGAGLVPLLVGVLNDLLEPSYGVYVLRYALTITTALIAVAGIAGLAVNYWVKQNYARAWANHPQPTTVQ